jgi:hypothetical protein
MICSKKQAINLKVQDICGAHTLTRVDGRVLHARILRHWKQAETIEIDFSNATIASVSFLDEAIGQLVVKFSKKEIGDKIKLIRISQYDRKLLNDIAAVRYRQILQNRKKPRTSSPGTR